MSKRASLWAGIACGVLLCFHAWPAGAQSLPAYGDWQRDSIGVRSALTQFLAAYENLDWEPFAESFAQDAMVFFSAPESPRGVQGKAAALTRFRLVFDGIRRTSGRTSPPFQRLRPTNLAVTRLGEDAVLVTFEVETAERLTRRTIVFARARGDATRWRIRHMHASNAPRSPASGASPGR